MAENTVSKVSVAVVPQPAVKPVADDLLRIHVKVYSPFKTYFDDDAKSISAINGTGPFDVLARHHNFMTLLNPCELVIIREIGPIRIKIARGVMHVKNNQVIVFLDV